MNLHQVKIESIDIEGKGIAHINGKAIFVYGALPSETVSIKIIKKKSNFDIAKLLEIIEPSSERVKPPCPNFGTCGGCSLQHIDFQAQVKFKENVLKENLWHIGKIKFDNLLPPILGEPWGYRDRARLSVHCVPSGDGVLIGFREKKSSQVANMSECQILPTPISQLIPHLRQLINQLSNKTRIPQIEIAAGESITVLVFRIMEPLNNNDENLIKNFVNNHSDQKFKLQIWLQPKGVETSYPFYPLDPKNSLYYTLPQFNLTIPFKPTEFTQVNPLINQQMVQLAIKLLDINHEDIIADFFCGIGNFTLAIAKYAKYVLGFEANAQLIERAIENATLNNLTSKTNFQSVNLFQIDNEWLVKIGKLDKWLIDPPRNGAIELIKALSPEIAPQKIVYISCNPATLARDASALVNLHNYKLEHAGVINMFPHTSHVESIAVFNKVSN